MIRPSWFSDARIIARGYLAQIVKAEAERSVTPLQTAAE